MTIENVKCPECNGPMKSRLNSLTQQRFWGCTDFPRCRGTRNTDGESPDEAWHTRRAQGDDGPPSPGSRWLEDRYDRKRADQRERAEDQD